MKRTFIAFITFIACAFAAQAAIVNCPPPQATVVADTISTPKDFACPAPDVDVVSIRLILSGTFQDNSSAGPDLSVHFSTSNTGGLTDLECTAIGATNANSQTLGSCVVYGDWVPASGLAAFLVTVTGNPGSDPLPFNGSASVGYEAETPEPAAYLMLGSALLALGVRRRLV